MKLLKYWQILERIRTLDPNLDKVASTGCVAARGQVRSLIANWELLLEPILLANGDDPSQEGGSRTFRRVGGDS